MYKKIMVPLDGSELAECVLPHVNGFVSGFQVDTIVFVRVMEPTPALFSEMGNAANPHALESIQKNIAMIDKERMSSAAKYLEHVISRLKQDGIKFKADVLVGQIADRLVDYVDANEIDLVLIATHGRSGINRWVRGSIADKVLRSARAPVLMVRADTAMSGEKV
jgi:nucleotide-binding universal stress UspA family protein